MKSASLIARLFRHDFTPRSAGCHGHLARPPRLATTTKPRLERLEDRLALSGFGPEDGSYIVEPWSGIYYGVQIQPSDQKIVAAGGTPDGRLAVARYDSFGNVDAAYGSAGVATPPLGPNTEQASSLVLQPDGKAVVVGNAGAVVGVARLNSNGSPDTSFGSGGLSTFNVQPNSSTQSGYGVALQSTGKIVVSGVANGPAPFYSSAFVARFKTSGAIDSGNGGFGQVVKGKATGAAIGTFGAPYNGYSDLAIQADDKVVVVGGSDTTGNGDTRLVVARYTAAGILDTTFNSSGYKVFVPTGIGKTTANSVALQADGKIVVVGNCTGIDGRIDLFVTRFNTNGQVDTAFGGGSGYVRFDADGTATSTAENAVGVAVQPDGKIVVGAMVLGLANPSMFSNPSSVLVARFNPNGALDASFGTAGVKVAAQPVDQAFRPSALALQANSDIIVVGNTHTAGELIYHPLLMRFSGAANPPAAAPSSAAATDSALLLLLTDASTTPTKRK